MALLQLFSAPSSLSRAVATATPTVSRLMKNSVNLQTKSLNALCICKPLGVHKRDSLIVRASSDIDGVDADPPTEEAKVDAVSVENLPLESKLQLKLEAKLRMKLAKKIRLRRKRLLRKRKLRKKGRWPPSKMEKNKNV